ncbi:hypothetical protein HQ531_03870 [bacterium]|nr:hypothetical protein [bacterium]
MKIEGLCTTCNNLATCMNRLANGMVIWYCEEFDDYKPVKKRPAPPSTTSKSRGNGRSKLMGLCINCENGENCPHARKTGGVWYCEQYE